MVWYGDNNLCQNNERSTYGDIRLVSFFFFRGPMCFLAIFVYSSRNVIYYLVKQIY